MSRGEVRRVGKKTPPARYGYWLVAKLELETGLIEAVSWSNSYQDAAQTARSNNDERLGGSVYIVLTCVEWDSLELVSPAE